ncbi:MAG: hypothetical protein KGZ59_06105 [Chitinophagaceae bacterium]|nr:hypothetical protein [Chitinophagaceae bacterium]
MKKIILILLVFCYATTSFGVSLNLFFCCGKLKTISVVTQANHDKVCKKSKECCKYQVIDLKVDVDQKNTVESTFSAPSTILVPTIYNSLTVYCISNLKKNVIRQISSDIIGISSLYIFYCVFRI